MLQAYEMLEKAGIVGYCLLGLSFLTLTITFSKLLQYTWFKISFHRGISQSVNLEINGKFTEAQNNISETDLWSKQLYRAVQNKGLAVNRDEEDHWDQETQNLGDVLVTRLESGLNLIALIAALSPLLGLLGTVIGMISAFQAMETAGSNVNPSLLSGGIWEALLTTAMGLVVAIPAMVLHSFLKTISSKLYDGVVNTTNVLSGFLYRKQQPDQPIIQSRAAE